MINNKGIALIKHFESLHDGDLTVIGLQPKMCPAGVWTVGYGHALRTLDGRKLLRGIDNKDIAYAQYPNLTELEACNMLAEDLEEFEHYVKQLVSVPINENQLAALTSFTYNEGYENFRTSTLLRLINNKHYNEAADQFKYWNKGSGKVLKGLVLRREAEKELFLTK